MVAASLKDPLLGQKKDSLNGENEEDGAHHVDDSEWLEEGVPILDPKRQTLEDKAAGHHVRHHGDTSFWQTTVNLVNILIGMGMITLPATFQEGGWLSLILLLAFAVICCYTGVMLGRCMAHDRSFKN